MNRQTPHLVPAFGAIALLICFLVGFNYFSAEMEKYFVPAVAPKLPYLANAGLALQLAAFQNPDMLVVYGSSEMHNPKSSYRAIEFFQTYPTGFAVMDIARGGVTSLNMAQNLAALGPTLNGKKVVISFTPSMFLQPEVAALSYDDNFSPLHAEGFVFNLSLSVRLKQWIAERMLAYPETLDKTPLLKFEMENLVNNSPFSLAMYYAAWPLGEMETTALQLEDHATALGYFWSRGKLPEPVRRAATINWAKETETAQAAEIAFSSSNSYGVDPNHWPYYEEILSHDTPPGSRDWRFLNRLRNSVEWTDFDLMLQVLKELGAKPLILSRPYNGPLFNAMGVSTQALNLSYDKLHAVVAPYQFPLVDFRQYTHDPYFSSDQSSHTSIKGWVYVDEILNSFYHDRIR